MEFVDAIELADGWRETNDGYMTANVKAARTGVQTYLGSEVGKPNLKLVSVYRPQDEVFSKKSMGSFVGKPVTDGHPKDRVTAENWKDHSRGTIGEEVARDGEAIRLSIALMDAGTIKKVKNGKRELSVGYTADLEWTAGKTDDGVSYDAIQRNIYVDHLAIVDAGRAGKEFRIGDSAEAWGIAPITDTGKEIIVSDIKTTTVVVGDEAVVTTDEGAKAINKLKATIVAKDQAISDAAAAHANAIVAKDTEIGKLQVQVKELQDKAPTPESIDLLVADRVAIVTQVKAIDASIITDGKSNPELKKAAVAKKFGDDFVKDASEATVDGMFQVMAKDAKIDPLQRSSVVSQDAVGDTAAAAYNDNIADLQNAWKGKK